MKNKKVVSLENNTIESFFVSYQEACEIVRELKIENTSQWKKYCQGKMHKEKPARIPSQPQRVYKDSWTGWGDFLGTSYFRGVRESKKVIRLNKKEHNSERVKNNKICHDSKLKVAV